MAIATVDDYNLAIQRAATVPLYTSAAWAGSVSVGRGRLGSMWTSGSSYGSGATPSTPVAPTGATTGAIPLLAAEGLRLLGCSVIGASNGVGGGSTISSGLTVVLCDRLSHQGGLSGTSALTQTTNLPTAALTRYTSGEGVMAAVEVYGTLGSTLRDVVCSYTNQAGVAARTGGPASLGGNSSQWNSINSMYIFSLQAGDTGVRSVENVTLSGSTGTAGNFGVTLFKPLAIIPVPFTGNIWPAWNGLFQLCANLPTLSADACLWTFYQAHELSVHHLNIQAQLNFDP